MKSRLSVAVLLIALAQASFAGEVFLVGGNTPSEAELKAARDAREREERVEAERALARAEYLKNREGELAAIKVRAAASDAQYRAREAKRIAEARARLLTMGAVQ